MILRRYCNGSLARWVRGSPVVKHRAEIAHIKPVAADFKFEKMVSLA
jgi:hypothetical protein